MTIIDPPPFLQHVLCLCFGRVGGAVGIDIGADVGEEVLAVAGLGDGRSEAFELALVVEKDFAVAGEVILFEGGGCEGGFGVEETGELCY